jgi:hypothetical protein
MVKDPGKMLVAKQARKAKPQAQREESFVPKKTPHNGLLLKSIKLSVMEAMIDTLLSVQSAVEIVLM